MSKSSYLTKLINLSIASAFAVVTMVACGGDDDDTVAPSANGGTTETGQGGSTNASGGNGAAGSTAQGCKQTDEACGCSTAGLSSTYGCVQACCKDGQCGSQLVMRTATGTCGVLKQPGPESASCPTYSKAMADAMAAAAAAAGIDAGGLGDIGDIGGGFMPYKGCCRPDGNCGFLVSSLGWGCVTATDVENILGVSTDTADDGQDIAVTITPTKCK